jgi:hypothetical protein
MELLKITPQLLAAGIPQVENIIDTLPNHPTKVFPKRSMGAVDSFILHHTASEAPLINQAKHHVNNNGWARIGYSIMIVDGSRIVQTNYLDVEAVHCAGWNHRSLGVCVLGDLSKRQLTSRERELLLAVFVSLNAMYPNRKILGHGECKPTACPVISTQKVREEVATLELKLALTDTPNDLLAKAVAVSARVEDLRKIAYDPKNKYNAEGLRKMNRIHDVLVAEGIL